MIRPPNEPKSIVEAWYPDNGYAKLLSDFVGLILRAITCVAISTYFLSRQHLDYRITGTRETVIRTIIDYIVGGVFGLLAITLLVFVFRVSVNHFTILLSKRLGRHAGYQILFMCYLLVLFGVIFITAEGVAMFGFSLGSSRL